MGNHQQGNNTTIVQVGSLRKNEGGGGIESNTNYIQMEEHKDQLSQIDINRQSRDHQKFFYWLNKFNCVQGIRNRQLPDWLGHAKFQLSQNQRFTQHHWAAELLTQVQNYSEYKDQQSQSISEIEKAAEKSYFDSTEYLARRKQDNWANKASSGKSSFSSSSSYTSEMRKSVIIQREKKLQDIIENTELLRESLQEERNSYFQMTAQQSHAARLSSSSSQQKQSDEDHKSDDIFAYQSQSTTSSRKGSGDSANFFWENDDDLTEEQQLREEEEYDKMFRNLNRYKEITRVLLKNLANVAKNPIAFLLSNFVEIFCYKYDSNKLSQPNLYLKVITEEVNDFLTFLSDLLRVYYKLDYIIYKRASSTQAQQSQDTSDMFLSSDNIHNFLCTALFSFDGFYRKIRKVFSEAGDKAEQQFRSQIDRKQNITMAELGIRKEFHLDKSSMIIQSPLQSSESSPAASTLQQQSSQNQPYKTVIEDFRRVSITKAPLQKLKVLLKIYESIELAIKEFYDSNQIPMMVSCDADNFLGIIQYVIIKSKAYNISTDIKLIESFVKNNSSKSASSYKLITLQGSIVHISTSP